MHAGPRAPSGELLALREWARRGRSLAENKLRFRCGPICSGPERRYSRAGPGPAARGSASVETNEQARHPAFGIGVGRSTHEKVGVDGGIGHLLLDVFFRFAMRYGEKQTRLSANRARHWAP